MSPSVEKTVNAQADGTSKSCNNDLFRQGGFCPPDGQLGSVATENNFSEFTLAPQNVQQQSSIKGKAFLVTGGGQGHGLAIAVYPPSRLP